MKLINLTLATMNSPQWDNSSFCSRKVKAAFKGNRSCFANSRPNRAWRFPGSKDRRAEKWYHYGSEEMSGTKFRRISRRISLPILNRIDLVKKVVLHITNLEPSVDSNDLNKLFKEYPVLLITVNYDEMGEPVGTADLLVDRATASEIMANYEGIIFNGYAMRFHLLDEKPTQNTRKNHSKSLLAIGARPKNAFLQPHKRFVNGYNKKYSYKKAHRRYLKKTTEELDRELEEYMNKSGKKNRDSFII